MAQERYQYGTSPRKTNPDYNKRTKKVPQKRQLKIVEDLPRQQVKVSKEQRKTQLKMTITVASLFLLLLSIENSLNLYNIEKVAKEELGMQKLSGKQTIYVTLPKKDHVESASEKIVIKEEKSWWEEIADKIFNF